MSKNDKPLKDFPATQSGPPNNVAAEKSRKDKIARERAERAASLTDKAQQARDARQADLDKSKEATGG